MSFELTPQKAAITLNNIPTSHKTMAANVEIGNSWINISIFILDEVKIFVFLFKIIDLRIDENNKALIPMATDSNRNSSGLATIDLLWFLITSLIKKTRGIAMPNIIEDIKMIFLYVIRNLSPRTFLTPGVRMV